MHPHLREILDSQKVRAADGEELPLHSNIPEAEGELLQEAVRELRPKISLEVGLAYGISAMFICEALKETGAVKHIAIDYFQNRPASWKGVGVLNLEKCGYGDMLQLIEKPSELALPELLEEKTRIDFAFIDGCHTFDHCLTDFFYVNRMLNVGGAVAFDDCNSPSIDKVLQYIRKYPAYEEYKMLKPEQPQTKRKKLQRFLNPRDVHYKPRCVILKKIAADERGWDWYRNF